MTSRLCFRKGLFFLSIVIYLTIAFIFLKNSDYVIQERSKPVPDVTPKKTKRCLPHPSINESSLKLLNDSTIDKVKYFVLFIGYSRSGHTLIGSLLDAHRHAIIANEYNILERFEKYKTQQGSKKNIFNTLYRNSLMQAKFKDRSESGCTITTPYNYHVPNQWQGTFVEKLQVIGDKKGGRTTLLFAADWQRFQKVYSNLASTVKIPMKLIHVIRNPYDVVGKIILRDVWNASKGQQFYYKNPAKADRELQIRAAEKHDSFSATNNRLILEHGKEALNVYSERMIKEPRRELLKLCEFLELECDDGYLTSCESIVYKSTSKSRKTIVWDNEAKNIIYRTIQTNSFYKGYNFGD